MLGVELPPDAEAQRVQAQALAQGGQELGTAQQRHSLSASPCGANPGAAERPKPRGTGGRTRPALTSFFMPGGQLGVARERKDGK